MSALTQEEINDLLDELRDVSIPAERPPLTYRTEELGEAWRLKAQAVRVRVSKLKSEGKIRPVPITHINIQGRPQTVVAFQIVR